MPAVMRNHRLRTAAVACLLALAPVMSAQQSGSNPTQPAPVPPPMSLPELPTPPIQPQPYQQNWVRITAPHLVIVTDAGDQRGRELALYLEQVRAAFGQLLLDGRLPQGAPLQVLAFSHHEKLNDFGLKMDRQRPTGQLVLDNGDIFADDGWSQDDVGGITVGEVYLQSGDEDFALLDLSSQRPWRAFLHSYTHDLLNANLPPLPRWFAEGFAQYISVIRVERDQPHEDSKGRDVVSYRAVSGFSSHPGPQEQMPMVELFGAANTTAEAGHAINSRVYMQAWREVEFLLAARKIAEARQCFELIRRGVPPAQAIEQAFGVAPAVLDAQAAEYFRARAPVSVSVPATSVETAAGPLSETDRRILFADIHSHEPGYHRVGAKEFEDVLRDQPGSAPAHRGLAMEDMRMHHADLALRQLAAAEELDPNDWLAHYYHAQILRQQNPQPLPELEKQARAVVRLNPDFAEGYAILGSVLGLQAKNTEAAAAYEQAVRLQPSSEVYAVNLGMLYCASGRCAEAKPIFASLVTSKDTRVSSTAEGYLKGMPK